MSAPPGRRPAPPSGEPARPGRPVTIGDLSEEM